MKKSTILWFVLLSGLLMSACHRQQLEEWYYLKASIPISVDWTVCGVDPQNVSVLFFNEKDGTIALQHFYENNTHSIQSFVEVPEGVYTVLLFNELPGQISNVNIEERDNFSTITAIGKNATSVSLPISGDVYLREPGELVSIIVEHFEVTSDMVYYTNEPFWIDQVGERLKRDTSDDPAEALLNLVPLNNLSQFDMKLHILGLNNSRMPALVNLRNMAESYSFSDKRDGMKPVTYQSTSNTHPYAEGQSKNGIIMGSINVFGVLGDQMSISSQPSGTPIILDIRLMLVDEERTIINRSYDITDKISFSRLTDGTILITLDIDDPDPLPDVIPEGGGGESGFETSVEDWEVIDVPLTAE